MAPTDGPVPPPDSAPDARADARLIDAAPDIGHADAALPDACVGVDPPPPPPASLDGREVCNYVDDDGDGRVDEGFVYRWLSSPVPLLDRPSNDPREPKLLWNGGVLAVAFELAPEGATFAQVDNRLCKLSGPIYFKPRDTLVFGSSAAVGPSGYALVFHHAERRGQASFSGDTWLQLIDLHGNPVRLPFQPVGELVSGIFSAVTSIGDDFGIFVRGFDSSRFVVVASDGAVVLPPTDVLTPEESASFFFGGGISYDGEGVGLVWVGIRDGARALLFKRWAPDGTILTPTTLLGWGVFQENLGLYWWRDRYYFAYESTTTYHGEARIASVFPDGQHGPEPRTVFADAGPRYLQVRIARAIGDQFILAGWLSDRPGFLQIDYLRTDGFSLVSRSASATRSAVAVSDGPSGHWIIASKSAHDGDWTLDLRYFGCLAGEEHAR